MILRIVNFLKSGRKFSPVLLGNLCVIGSTFLLSKYVAVMYGPGGMALLGQYSNILGLLQNLSTAGIDNGVVRYVAEADSDSTDSRKKYLSASLQIVLIFALITFIFVISNSEYIADKIFFSGEYHYLVMLIGCVMLPLALQNWIKPVMNGMGSLNSLAFVNVLMAVGVVFLVISGFFSPDLAQSQFFLLIPVTLIFSMFFCLFWGYKKKVFYFHFGLMAEKSLYLKFFKYSMMSGTAAVVVPVVAISVRNVIVNYSGVDDAGLFEAVSRFSNAYLSVITTTLAVYFLPQLSAAKNFDEQTVQMHAMMRKVVSLVFVLSVFVWIAYPLIFSILYSDIFVVSRKLMLMQVTADIFKMASWVLAYQMIARGMAYTYIILEVSFGLMRYIASLIFVPWWGLDGAVAAYMVTNIVYLLVLIFLFRDQFKRVR